MHQSIDLGERSPFRDFQASPKIFARHFLVFSRDFLHFLATFAPLFGLVLGRSGQRHGQLGAAGLVAAPVVRPSLFLGAAVSAAVSYLTAGAKKAQQGNKKGQVGRKGGRWAKKEAAGQKSGRQGEKGTAGQKKGSRPAKCRKCLQMAAAERAAQFMVRQRGPHNFSIEILHKNGERAVRQRRPHILWRGRGGRTIYGAAETGRTMHGPAAPQKCRPDILSRAGASYRGPGHLIAGWGILSSAKTFIAPSRIFRRPNALAAGPGF